MTQNEIMNIQIKDTPLSGRTKNCLKFAGIEYVSNLTRLEALELLGVPNMGRRSVEEVIEYLSSLGFTLKGQDKFYKRKQKLPWVVKLIEEAVIKEREACEKACANERNNPDDQFKNYEDTHDDGWIDGCNSCIAAIRARGEA